MLHLFPFYRIICIGFKVYASLLLRTNYLITNKLLLHNFLYFTTIFSCDFYKINAVGFIWKI